MTDKHTLKSLDDRTRIGISFSLRSKMLLYFGTLFVVMLSTVVLVRLYGLPLTPYKGERSQLQSKVFQHHGRTWVESKQGKGSKFLVSLPSSFKGRKANEK